MTPTRRSFLSAIGFALPFAPAPWSGGPAALAPVLRFRDFEDAVREAFRGFGAGPDDASALPGRVPCRRIPVGHSTEMLAGVQGCHNDRPFAGFPAGRLRIVRAGSEPGPLCGGVRLYVSTVDVTLIRGQHFALPSRPLDFAALPPAPVLCQDPREQAAGSGRRAAGRTDAHGT